MLTENATLFCGTLLLYDFQAEGNRKLAIAYVGDALLFFSHLGQSKILI